MKIKKKIVINDWLRFKPYWKAVPTDMYYAKLCNEVKSAIWEDDHFFLKINRIDETEINYLSCFLTSYFEDVISGSNIWPSFVRMHKRLYGKQLPFFDLEGYCEGEINFQDVCFLIWYFFNSIQEKDFSDPFNRFFFETAEEVFLIFDDAWEEAPENDVLPSYYQLRETETNFYNVKNLIETVFNKTYLFFPDTTLALSRINDESLSKYRNHEQLPFILKDNIDNIVARYHTRLFALKGKDWIAEIIGENHPLHADILAISPKIQSYFLYKGQDETDIFIEHIASGKQFNLTKKSYDHPNDLTVIDTILYIGIVKWKGEWWFSGVHFQFEYNEKIVSIEKNSKKSFSQVNFLDHQTHDTSAVLKRHEMAFLNFNQGSPIAFMPAGEADKFVYKFTDFYNHTYDSSGQKTEVPTRAGLTAELTSEKDDSSDYSEGFDSALIYFNPKRGCEIVFDVNSAFPLPHNPYFDTELSEEHIISILMDDSISPELAMYCIDNFREELPFFDTPSGKIYLEDIDFLLRFWKRETYHTNPGITFL